MPEFDLKDYQYGDTSKYNDEVSANWVYMHDMAKFFYKGNAEVAGKSEEIDFRFDEIFRFERSLANVIIYPFLLSFFNSFKKLLLNF